MCVCVCVCVVCVCLCVWTELPGLLQLGEVAEALLCLPHGSQLLCQLVANFPESFMEGNVSAWFIQYRIQYQTLLCCFNSLTYIKVTTHTLTHPHMHTHRCMQWCTQTHARVCTHTHTHTNMQISGKGGGGEEKEDTFETSYDQIPDKCDLKLNFLSAEMCCKRTEDLADCFQHTHTHTQVSTTYG